MINLTSKIQYFVFISCSFKKKAFEKLVNTSNDELVDEKGFDLLTKMLTIDQIDRITAKEGLIHPYFDSIRQQA